MENIERVKQQLKEHHLEDRYIELPASTATVALAAQAIGCEEGLIAKTLSFNTKNFNKSWQMSERNPMCVLLHVFNELF